jgi:Protein of unknown function (DUF2867)
MTVVPCELPANTMLDRELVDSAFFTDSYRVPLRHDASVVDIFFAVFGHHPVWLKAILLIRHRVGAWFGLKAASAAQIVSPTRVASYRVGENIGPWPIYFLGEGELVAGRDNKHLDFRLSVLKQRTDQAVYAVVSTVCRTHNWFGRMYLLLIAPFHKWGLQRLLFRAARTGRL